MQTFLPFPNLTLSCRSLCKKRVFKQAVEARQILNVLDGVSEGWKNHPAVKMWRGHNDALAEYYNTFLAYSINVHKVKVKKLQKAEILGDIVYPKWFGDNNFHQSHRNNLARKAFEDIEKRGDYNLYNALIGVCVKPEEQDINGEYIWPIN